MGMMGRGLVYGGGPGRGEYIPNPRVEPDPIQEYKLGLQDQIVRMRPNPKRDNGLVIRMQGKERLGDPELMTLVELRALYKSLLEQGYSKL